MNKINQKIKKTITNKKIIIIIICIICLTLIIYKTISTTTIICNSKNNSYNATTDSKMVAKFIKDNFEEAEFDIKYKLDSSSLSQINPIYKQIKNQYREYTKQKGINIKLSKQGGSINAKIIVTKEGIANYIDNKPSKKVSKEKLIEKMKQEGYKCSK